MTIMCYTGTEEQVSVAVEQINSNCGFPDGYTETWDTPRQAYEQDFWFIIMPPAEGYKEPTRSFTQEQMIAGVTNVQEQESQPDWWPPIDAPVKKRRFWGLFNAKSS